MNDYTPGWQFVFPEPDRGESAPRPTGPRRTQEDVGVCQECGCDLDEPPVTFEGHSFCSRPHLDSWLRRSDTAGIR